MDLAALQKAVGEAAPMPTIQVRNHNEYVTAHVDGDYMAYYAAGSDECSAGEARRNVLSRLSKLRTVSGAAKVIMHLTHGASTKGERYLVAQTQPYQAQRSAGRKPKNWAFLREWMEEYSGDQFTPKVWLSREADDGIAHVCHSVAKHQNILHVVHSADKDMRMFCGVHVSWKDYHITEVPLGAYDIIGADGEQYGHKWFWFQMLTGDAADHIPGLPRVGPKTAEAALAGTSSNEDAARVVRGLYSETIGEEWVPYFVEQAMLLWMRTDRSADIGDFLTLGVFGDSIIAEVERVRSRVLEERTRLMELSQ